VTKDIPLMVSCVISPILRNWLELGRLNKSAIPGTMRNGFASSRRLVEEKRANLAGVFVR
jgi:hypothetical protein